tara:strand:- start:934 stop:2646 length:1713 start_codon:yes stop_codon:yes gene_type:complete
MSPMVRNLPSHLKKYVASQHFDSYTPEEHATWRYLLRQLKAYLKDTAHPCYLDGLEKTGVREDRIPKISEMDELLQKFGWGAVPVSGFIPPAAFMEFQSLGILPIASDMRSIGHMLYTPAPDIVHEAAGHAPILIHPEYAAYLKSYAQVAKKAIISREDLNQYEAIRKLSDIKEHPHSTKEDIEKAEAHLDATNKSMTYISEASLLSRMNWWTAEYGLIGDLKHPQIYGAGLLSSLGESRDCLKDHVRKIPLSVDCVDVSYDITEPQPQLFVTPNFEHLQVVLEDLAQRLSFRKGGIYGLNEALRAKSVNTVELDSGLQISAILESFKSKDDHVSFLKFSGPSQLSLSGQQLEGHGKDFHAHGYSTPLGPLSGLEKPLNALAESERKSLGLEIGKSVDLKFSSGIQLKGSVKNLRVHKDQLILITLDHARMTLGEELLFDPDWGTFDLACGNKVTSVFGGPADREAYGEVEDFVAERVPSKNPSDNQIKLFTFYDQVRKIREKNQIAQEEISGLWNQFQSLPEKTWLAGYEVLELAHLKGFKDFANEIEPVLRSEFARYENKITDGLRLI